MADSNESDAKQEQADIEQAAADVKLMANLLAVAKEHYGDQGLQFDDDSQFMFALACDTVRASAYTDAVEPIGTLRQTQGEACAEVLGPVVANICPGWVIEDDSHRLPV